MKKIVSLLLLLSAFRTFSQAPSSFNYQGQVRDVNGAPVTSLTSIGVKFQISDASNNLVHDETQSGVSVNNIGLFNTQIGLSPALSNTITWQNGPYTLSVSVNTGAGFQLMGAQQMVSVPFALYAKSAGGTSMPTGTVTGQTMYWDQGTSTWKVTSHLHHDGLNVAIGSFTGNIQNKLQVHTLNPSDSSAILAYKQNANARDAGIRTYAVGSTPSSTNIGQNAIFGADAYGINNSGGPGIGLSALGASGGYAYGVTGIAMPTNSTAYAIGIYGGIKTNTPSATNFAGYFDGTTFIRDSLFLGFTANPGAPGDVLTRSSTGKARWQPAAGGVGPWTAGAGYVYPTNLTHAVGIGIGTLTPLAKLDVFNSSGNAIAANTTNSYAIIANSSSTNSSLSSIYATNSGNGYAIYGNTGSTINSISAIFGNNSGSGHGLLGNTSSTLATSSGVYGSNTGSGNGVTGSTGSGSGSSSGVAGSNTGSGHGVFGITSSSLTGSNGVLGQNNGAGSGVAGVATSSSGVGVSGNNPAGTGVLGQSNVFSANGAAVYGLNNGGGYGMLAYANNAGSANAIGLRALSISSFTNSAAIKGEATGSGISIWGVKDVNAPIGPAGKFDIQNTNNNAPAVHALTSGTGAAVEAEAVSANSKVALRVINGHIKANFSSGVTSGLFNYSGPSSPSVITNPQSNDVRGVAQVSLAPITWSPGSWIEFDITYNKAYTTSPYVVITPATAALSNTNWDYMVIQSNPGFFRIRVQFMGSTAIVMTSPNNNFIFNYIVIE